MARSIPLAGIQARFPSEWVLLEDPETSEMLEVRSGKVLWHSKDRDDVYHKALELRPRHSAIVYTGSTTALVFVWNPTAIDGFTAVPAGQMWRVTSPLLAALLPRALGVCVASGSLVQSSASPS